MIIDNLINGEISQQDIWNAYLEGVSYNADQDLAAVVEENNNMYVGRQWEGIEQSGLPTISLNFIKPAVQYKVANIMSTNTKITVQPSGLAGLTTKQQRQFADVVNAQLEMICERIELPDAIEKLETHTAVDGDGCWHVFWNNKIKTGQALPGDIDIEQVRNVNVYFGNPANNEVDEQPYIIIERREYISLLKARAKELGLDEMDIANIQADSDNQYTISNDDNRVTVLTFYWRDYATGTIRMIECTQNVILQKDRDTGLESYPPCWQNWEPRLNDYHGESCVSELVTNQLTTNKLSTMQAVSISRTAFPTILYNADLLPDGWDNSVGAAIGVPNLPNLNAKDVATTIDPANHSSELDRFVSDFLIDTTMNLSGINEAVLGSINPENTSAIIAVQKSAAVPLKLNQIRLYKFLQDFARICIDFMANYYGVRKVLMLDEASGEEQIVDFDFSQLKNVAFNIKIEVGASSYWSEVTELQTLDNLFNKQIIDAVTYLEELPNGLLANKNSILKKLKAAMSAEQSTSDQGALQTMLQKSPETAAKLKALKQANPQQYEQVVKQLNTKRQG